MFRLLCSCRGRRSALVLLTFSIFVLPGSARAEGDTVAVPPLVVTATRIATPQSQLGSSVTVITEDEIAASGKPSLPDVLRMVPGMNVVQAGGPGGTTSVFTRGTNANHTKVLIDGIDASDPSSADGSFDFAHITTADIARIEVLRGPQSGLYGSDAIGGVINIITKKGEGSAVLSGSVEGGSFSTFNQSAAVRGGMDRFNYALSFDHLHVGGTPVTPSELLPAGRARIDDSYGNETFGMKLGANVTPDLELGLVARYVDTVLRSTGDDFSTFPSTPAAAQSESNTQQLFTRASATQKLLDGRVEQTLGFNLTQYWRNDLSPGSAPTPDRGRRLKGDWQGSVKLIDGEIAILGAELQRDEIIASPISAHVDNAAGFAELQSAFGTHFFSAASLRYDSSDMFGPALTFRVAPAIVIAETGTKLKASVGSGFKGPSLNQLFVSFPAFNFFANPNLRPEKSLGNDMGFEQFVLDKNVQFGATYFYTDTRNLIALNAAGNSNTNIARAEAYGVESFAAVTPTASIDLRVDHTFTIANDAVLHQELLHRPKHKATASTTWRATSELRFHAEVVYAGPRVDGNRDFSVPRMKANGYTTANLAGSYDVTKDVTAFIRIDNLLDRRYQEPVGFLRPGLGIFAGVKIALDTTGW
jgi:vitamin B12 transporter